jgi:hypothetical protein
MVRQSTIIGGGNFALSRLFGSCRSVFALAQLLRLLFHERA